MSTCKINPVVAESTNTAFSIFVQRELDKFDNAVDYTFNVRKEKGVPKEIVTLKVKLADNTEVDLSEAATNEYAKILGSTGNKVVLRSNIRPLYGSATRSGQTVVLDGNSLMKEFTNYIFNHIEFSSGQAAYKSKRFNNLTEFLAESNDSHIETILNKFYAESSQRGVLQQIEDELKGDPTEQEKQLNRVKQELKNRLAGYKISLTELEEEYEITEDDKGNQDWTDSNRQEPTSFADSLLRLYLSSVLDDRGNPYEARNLQNRLLKSYAHLSAQEVEDDLRKAYENPTNLNSFKVQIYRDLFLPETSITPNGKSKLSRIELRHQQIREQAKLSLLTFISKAVAEPINIVKLADGAVIANDSVLETEYNVAIKTVQEILKTFSTGETTAGLTMFKFSGNQFELQEKALNFTKPLNTNNDIGQFLYETGLFNTVFGRVKEDAEEKFGQFMTFLEAFPVEKAKFTGYVNELQKALLNAVAFTNKTDGKIIANDLFTPYGSHYLPNTGNIPVYKNLQTAYKELIGFLHTYYEEYPRNNRYMKEGKSVYQVSLSNTANNNVQDLKREFADPASRVDPSLFLGKILTHVDFTKLGIKEIVQIEDQSIGREAAFGFMEPDEFVQSIIIGLANLNAVSSLRAADRGLQRAFTGLVSAEIDRQKALDILRDMLRSEIATALYFRTNESVFNLLEGTQYQLSAKNLRIFKELQDDGSQDTDTNVNLEALAETLQTTLNKLKLETYDELKDTIFAFIDDYFKTANFDSYFDKLIEAQTEQFANSLANSMGISGNVAVDSVAAKLSKAFADKIVNSGNIINSRDIAKKLALMFVPGTLMQQYISFGDIGNFKPDAVKKRVDGNFSTRENSPQMGQTHFDTMNRLFPRMDGKSHSNEITDLVIAEPKKALDGSILPFYEESLRREAKVIYPNNESLQESYVESRLAEAKKDGFIDIIDATTYTSLDYFEQSMLNNSSLSYSEQHKAAVQYEKQLLAYSFLRLGLTYGQFGQSNQGQNNLNDPLMTIEKFNRLFGPQLSRPLTQEDVDENKFSPQYNGITIKPENFAIGLSIKKDQGYTQVTAIFNPETNTHEREAFKHLGLMELFKTAPNVIIPSNTKGAFANTAAEALRDPMYKLAAFMFAQQIDTIAPPSGRKFMKGSMNKDTGFVMSGNKVDFAIGDKIKHRQLSTRNLGKQLETGDFEKGSVTLSTQFRRLIGLDLTSFVDEDGKQMLYASFNRVSKYLNNASEKRFVHELQKLGYDVKYVNGKVQYSLDINDQETLINFIDKLSEQYQTRSVKVAVLEEFEALKNAVRQGLVSFDFSLQRSTIENSISKKVKSSNNVKVNGEMYIQETAFLYNENLKMYDVGDEDIITLAEVIVPLPKRLAGYVNAQYSGNTFREKLDKFNETIANGTSKIDPNILEFMANRIPSQSAASVEAFRIKKFLMPHSGARIVLPLDFVFKSGSDFDVDKLTSYLNSIQFNKEGHPYVPYAQGSQFVEDVFRPEYFEELSLGLEYGLSVAGVSDADIRQQIDSLFNDFNALIEKSKDSTEEIKDVLKENEVVYNKFLKLLEEQERKIAVDRRYSTTAQRRDALEKSKADLILKAYEGTEVTKDAQALIQELEEGIKLAKGYLQKPPASRVANMQEFESLKNRFKAIISSVKSKVDDETYRTFLQTLVPTKIMDNVALREIKQLFRHIENINLLYTPIAAPYLKHLATKELAAPVEAKDYLTSFTLNDEIAAFESFIGAAIPLGQAATANVLHSLAQWYPIRLKANNNLGIGNLFENVSRDENGNFAIGNKLDGYGNPKSRIYNEQITGYVDVAKDPFIMRLLVHGRTYKKFLFMHEVFGIPMRQIVKTFAAPGVYAVLTEEPAVVLQLIDKLKKVQARLPIGPITKVNDAFLDKFYYFENKENVADTTYKNDINYIKNNDEAKLVEMFTSKGVTKSDIDILIKLIKSVDELTTPSTQLGDLVEILRADSKFTNNRLETSVLSAIRGSFNAPDFPFEAADIQRLIDNTYLSRQIAHQYSLTDNAFNEYGQGVLSRFFLTESPVFSAFKDPIINNIIFSGIPATERTKSFARIEDTLLTYLVSDKVFNGDIEGSFKNYLLNDTAEVHNKLERLIAIVNGGDIMTADERAIKNALALRTTNEIAKLRNFLARFKPSVSKFTLSGTDYTIKSISVVNDKLSISEEYDTLVDGFSYLQNLVALSKPGSTFSNFTVDLIKHLLLQYGLINGPNPWKNNISPIFYMNLILSSPEIKTLGTNTTREEVQRMFLRAVQANNGYNGNKSPDLSVIALKQPRFMQLDEDYPLSVSAAEGGKVHTDSLQVVLPYDIKTIEKLTPVAKVRFVRFLNTLTSNPYIIVQTYKEKGKGPKAVFVFSGVNGNRLVFDKLNTLGKYWNITLDLTNLGTTRHGFVSNIPSNNVLSQEALQNTLPLLSESDRLRHIQVALNTVKQLPMSMEFANIKPAQIITKEQTAASTPASQSTLPTASIKMQPNNIEKIKKGTKTTTTRSETQAKEINIPVGTSAIVTFGNERFIVTNRGLLTIQEAGGKDAVLKSEGVANESELMYQQTKDWVNGEGKLYVYDIAPATQPTTQQPDGTTPPTC